MSMEVTIEDLATPALEELARRLRSRKDLHERMGYGASNLVKRHFLAKNKEPNKKGWRKTGFFGREGLKNTRLETVDESGATVTVASKPMALRYYGGTLRKSQGFFGIPQREEHAGKYARKFIEERGGLEGSGLFFRRSGAGRLYLAEREGGNGALRVHYFFVKQVTHKPDSSVLPTEKELRDTISNEAGIYLEGLAR